MPDIHQLIIWQWIIIGGAVLAVQGRRLKRLEKVPSHPLTSQIGRLEEQVRRLEADLDAVAWQVEQLPEALAERVQRNSRRRSTVVDTPFDGHRRPMSPGASERLGPVDAQAS